MNRLLVLSFALAIAVTGTACHRQRSRNPMLDLQSPAAAAPAPATATVAFANSAQLLGPEVANAVVAKTQVDLSPESDRLLIHATGEDPQLAFNVLPANLPAYAVRVDMTAPVETVLEVFYSTNHAPMSASHVARCALHKGRNDVLLQIADPQFSGELRLDPGQLSGDYILYAVQIFAPQPVRFVAQQRAQEQLEADFARVGDAIFSAHDANGFAQLKPLQDARATGVSQTEMAIEAAGTDPQLLLPPLDGIKHAIVKVTLVAPAATTLQVFYREAEQTAFDEAHSSSREIPPGESTTYLEVSSATGIEVLRVDPGTSAGHYAVKAIEVRRVSP